MESTLSVPKSELEAEIARFFGYPSDPDDWSDRQRDAIVSIRKSGERQVYYPPQLPGAAGAYDWSFLKPIGSFTLEASASSVLLPDDFGQPEGECVVVRPGGTACIGSLRFGGIGTVIQRQAQFPDTTGQPQILCLEPLKGTATDAGQRSQLRVWPTADQAYTLRFQYYIHPNALSDNRPYTYGGMAHAELFIESCLAVAEQRLDDAMGIHTQKFMERLAASMSLDRRNKPQLTGYNGDRSDGLSLDRRRNMHGWGPTITFNGIEPG